MKEAHGGILLLDLLELLALEGGGGIGLLGLGLFFGAADLLHVGGRRRGRLLLFFLGLLHVAEGGVLVLRLLLLRLGLGLFLPVD